jgi:hypothetical protein
MSLHRLRKVDTLPDVGRDIDAWCTRCKRDLGHVITAMKGGVAVQVRCHTCGSVHRFRNSDDGARAAASPGLRTSERAPTAAAKNAAAKVAAIKVTADRLRYDRMMAERKVDAAKPYTSAMDADNGDVVTHAKFGVGVVEFCDGAKARVLFADGARTLVVGRV